MPKKSFRFHTAHSACAGGFWNGSTAPLKQPALAANGVTIWIGGLQARISWAGIVASGEFQFNVTAPELSDGDQPVVAEVGGLRTQTNAFITVQR